MGLDNKKIKPDNIDDYCRNINFDCQYVIDLIKKYPNNMELGDEIRKYYNNLKK